MEQNISEETTSFPWVDMELLSALDWNDSIGTLPGSNLQFCLNEFGLLEVVTEAEAEAIRGLSALIVNAPSTSFAPAAVD
ncbi:Lethal(3)malignant brain tumor-like 3, partial [Merops nubicus]